MKSICAYETLRKRKLHTHGRMRVLAQTDREFLRPRRPTDHAFSKKAHCLLIADGVLYSITHCCSLSYIKSMQYHLTIDHFPFQRYYDISLWTSHRNCVTCSVTLFNSTFYAMQKKRSYCIKMPRSIEYLDTVSIQFSLYRKTLLKCSERSFLGFY